MAFTYSIQPTLPPDTGEKPSLGASRIRNFKNALIERLTSWIYGMDAAGSEAIIGLKSAPLRVQSSVSTPDDGVAAYSKAVGDNDEFFIKDKSGNDVQITNDGGLKEATMQTPVSNPTYPLSYDSIFVYEAYYSRTSEANIAANGYLRVKDGTGTTKIQLFLQATAPSALSGYGLSLSGTVPVPAGYTATFTENARVNLNAATETKYATQIS